MQRVISPQGINKVYKEKKNYPHVYDAKMATKW